MSNAGGPLESISLFGYKSIRELSEFPLRPDLNVLIGANGSGKTNFIRFFEMLGHMMDSNKGLQNYVRTRGGADAFLFRGMKVTPEFSASIELGNFAHWFRLRGTDDRALFFSKEGGRRDSSAVHAGFNYGSGHLESALPYNDPLRGRAILRDLRVHHFNDTSPSAPMLGRANIVDSDVLYPDAANLAAFLMAMRQIAPDHFARIEETIRQVAPFFGAFVLKEVAPGQTQLLWKERYSDAIYYPSQLSDGTLRYICLATLLLQPNPPSTVIVDEPELGLHPHAIKLLASMIHEASQRTQLIIATQSPQLLDEMTPEHVIVVNHKNGESVLERLDAERLTQWLEEYTLGQLWEKNELGGLP